MNILRFRIAAMAAVAMMLLPTIAGAQSRGRFPRIVHVIYDHTALYDSASYHSQIVQDLKLGDSVRALGIVGRFLHVETGTITGYVNASSTADSAFAPALPTVTLPTPETDRSGTKTTSGERAATQCLGITKAGKRCLRTTTDPSGYCWQHRKN